MDTSVAKIISDKNLPFVARQMALHANVSTPQLPLVSAGVLLKPVDQFFCFSHCCQHVTGCTSELGFSRCQTLSKRLITFTLVVVFMAFLSLPASPRPAHIRWLPRSTTAGPTPRTPTRPSGSPGCATSRG